MIRRIVLCSAALLVLTFQAVSSVVIAGEVASEAGGDHRQLVEMPEQAQHFIQQEMLGNLVALNQILTHLANDNLADAADVAETKMGRSAMGKHRASGAGPGRFMPLEMRNIGWGMHDAASEFAQAANKGDRNAANQALQKVTAACVACHYGYRIR